MGAGVEEGGSRLPQRNRERYCKTRDTEDEEMGIAGAQSGCRTKSIKTETLRVCVCCV